MGVKQERFGMLPDGRVADLFTLENSNGMRAVITNAAAAIVSIFVPDRNGKMDDVVLGYSSPDKYWSKGAYHGAVVGRVANRIEDAVFTMDGKTYRLKPNFQGRHMIHGGEVGLDNKLYRAEITGDAELTLTCTLPDGEDGFPGNVDVKVTYQLRDDNGLAIHYRAVPDAKTPINLINHAYFNLSGHDAGSILNHQLRILAETYNPLAENGMVYGVSTPVDGPMDFRQFKEIGRDIRERCTQLKIAGGYDHNYELGINGGEIKLAAQVIDDASGRMMEVLTNSPGILFYSGNSLAEHPVSGKTGRPYQKWDGFCLETNFPPNALKYPTLPQPVFCPECPFDYRTVYRFGIAK